MALVSMSGSTLKQQLAPSVVRGDRNVGDYRWRCSADDRLRSYSYDSSSAVDWQCERFVRWDGKSRLPRLAKLSLTDSAVQEFTLNRHRPFYIKLVHSTLVRVFENALGPIRVVNIPHIARRVFPGQAVAIIRC